MQYSDNPGINEGREFTVIKEEKSPVNLSNKEQWEVSDLKRLTIFKVLVEVHSKDKLELFL